MAYKPAGITSLNSVNTVTYSNSGMKSVSFKAPCSTPQDRENFIIKVQDIVDKCAGGLIFTGTENPGFDSYLLQTCPKPGSNISHYTDPNHFITALTYMNKNGVLSDDALEYALGWIKPSQLEQEALTATQKVSR